MSSQSAPTQKCPFCAEEILVDAKKCKHCGEFLEEKPVVIEQTSKRYKKQMLVGVTVSVFGTLIFVIGVGISSTQAILSGFLTIIIGIFIFIHARYKAWWHHG